VWWEKEKRYSNRKRQARAQGREMMSWILYNEFFWGREEKDKRRQENGQI
jgi:hypothetical protein